MFILVTHDLVTGSERIAQDRAIPLAGLLKPLLNLTFAVEPFPERMARLAKTLGEQFDELARLEKKIRGNLKGLGYEV